MPARLKGGLVLRRCAKARRGIRCVYCDDPALSYTDKGPACPDCANEIDNGKPPPMFIITSKHPPARPASPKAAEDIKRRDLWGSD